MTYIFSALTDSNRRNRCVSRRDLRGFTLTEIVVVIFMIAVLAAVASPAFVKVMRDSNLSRLNMQIAEVYRTAYLESAAQSTTLVRYIAGDPTVDNDTATPFGFALITSTLDTAAPTLVSPRRCAAINWDNPANTVRLVLLRRDLVPNAGTIKFLANNNQETTPPDVCYAQRRAFVRVNNGVFTEMQGVARVAVQNTQSNVTRRVLIPAFGLPRLIQ